MFRLIYLFLFGATILTTELNNEPAVNDETHSFEIEMRVSEEHTETIYLNTEIPSPNQIISMNSNSSIENIKFSTNDLSNVNENTETISNPQIHSMIMMTDTYLGFSMNIAIPAFGHSKLDRLFIRRKIIKCGRCKSFLLGPIERGYVYLERIYRGALIFRENHGILPSGFIEMDFDFFDRFPCRVCGKAVDYHTIKTQHAFMKEKCYKCNQMQFKWHLIPIFFRKEVYLICFLCLSR